MKSFILRGDFFSKYQGAGVKASLTIDDIVFYDVNI